MIRLAHHPRRGLRFSLIDAVVLVLCVAATVVFWSASRGLVVLAPVVLGHFFLFCNVFRVQRSSELVWAAVFLVVAGWWLLRYPQPWWWLVVLPAPVTLWAVLWAIRRPDYHGVLARCRPAADVAE